MDYSLIFVGVVLGISGILFYKKKQERDKKSKLTHNLQLKFKNNMKLNTSIYQSVILSKENSVFDKMYTFLTLKKDFCLTQILLNEQSDKIIMKGYLNYKRPNFYINNVKNGSKHFGQKFCNASKIKKVNYNLYGNITKLITDFCNKYTFDNIYCSYWPNEYTEFKNGGYNNSVVYFEGNINLIDDEEFVKDFFYIFEDVHYEIPKQTKEEFLKFKEELDKKEEYEKKSFMEKILSEIQNKSNSTAIVKKKKKSKRICKRNLSLKAMKSVLISNNKVKLFSTNDPTFNVKRSDNSYMTRSCMCLISNIMCVECNIILGYSIIEPCQECLNNKNNGHLWMFDVDKVHFDIRMNGLKILRWNKNVCENEDIEIKIR